MIIWTEKRVRAIVKEELGYLLDAISETQLDLNKVLRQTKTDHLNLAREIEILKSKAVDSRDLKTEIEILLEPVRAFQEKINSAFKQTKTDHLNLAREIESLGSKKAADSENIKTVWRSNLEKILRKTSEDAKCMTKLKPKRGRGRPRKNQ